MFSGNISMYKENYRSQKGAASLVMSMVILALITFVTIYTSKTILLEKKIANSDVRAKQAFGAAEAGIAEAVAYLSEDPDRDADGNVDSVFDTDGDGIGDSNTATIGNGSVTVTTTDGSGGDMTILNIVSVGLSGDNAATRTVYRTVSTLNPLPNNPDNPFTTRGAVVITGSATVYNPEGASTIWSGGDVALGSNNATSTEVADVSDAGYPTCMDTPMTCPTVSSSNKTTVGLDVIEYDSNLANLTPDEFFQNFFGMSMTAFKDSMVSIETDNANASTDAHLATKEIIWVDGSGGTTDLSGVTVGCKVAVTGSGVCTSANTKPSILVVDGDVTFSGSPQFYGIVFVTGSITAGSNTTVHGALVGADTASVSTGGSLDIYYNSDILQAIARTGPTGASAGSWRDYEAF